MHAVLALSDQNWGSWGPVEACPTTHFATGFRTRITNNEAITRVEMRCSDGSVWYSAHTDEGTLASDYQTCAGGFVGIRMEYQTYQVSIKQQMKQFCMG